MRARTHFEEAERGKTLLVIDELPYQVNKANLLMRIAELVREKRLEGIAEIRDESDKSGMAAAHRPRLCARRGPPTGGPPDIEPPQLAGSAPDSGAAAVGRDVEVSLTFSEGMDPRATAEAISIAPRVDIRERHWSGRTVTIAFAETLAEDQTYTVFLGSGARDRHGSPLQGGATVVFTTADTMPAGVLDGQVIARGFPAVGTYLWCYDAAAGRDPDSTARDLMTF